MSQSVIEIYNEGCNYYEGTDGYTVNYNKAFECFKKAADLGSSQAMNYLGTMYENGEAVSRDYRLAVEWFRRAINADSKNAHAAYNLSRMYYSGLGTEKNMVKAYQYGKTAVDLGLGNTHTAYSASCYLTGCILMEHYNNYKDAYSYFVDAAKYGDIPEAWYNLGWLTVKGVVPVNDPGKNPKAARDGMARGFYEKAANLGYAPAMDEIGRLHLSYNMVEEARPWIEKAAAMGYEPAKKRLKLLNFSRRGSLFDLFK